MHLFVDEHRLLPLAVVNNAAVNMGVVICIFLKYCFINMIAISLYMSILVQALEGRDCVLNPFQP